MKRGHAAEQDNTYYCHICNKAYISDRALKIHKSKDIFHRRKVTEAHVAHQPAYAPTTDDAREHSSGQRQFPEFDAADELVLVRLHASLFASLRGTIQVL